MERKFLGKQVNEWTMLGLGGIGIMGIVFGVACIRFEWRVPGLVLCTRLAAHSVGLSTWCCVTLWLALMLQSAWRKTLCNLNVHVSLCFPGA